MSLRIDANLGRSPFTKPVAINAYRRLPAGAPANALLTAIETVAAGGTAFPDAGPPHVSRLQPDLTLTARQIEILQCEARGLLAKQTAHRLGISEDRVNEHLRTLRARLGAATNADLVRQAIEHGFLSPLTPLPPPGKEGLTDLPAGA